MIELLHAHPGWGAHELAGELDLSESWLAWIMSTDLFQTAMAAP